MGELAAKNKILSFTDPDEIGGQTFVGFPQNAHEVAQRWAEVWFELIKDMIAPPMAAPPTASKEAWASTMEPIAMVPNGGMVALNTASLAAYPALAAAIAPKVLVPPGLPPAPLIAILAPAMAPFIVGSSDPIGPAVATVGAMKAWLMTGMWSIPAPPTPTPFQVAP